jgi:hypothetical protein
MKDASENEDAAPSIHQPTAREHDPENDMDRTKKLRQMMEEGDARIRCYNTDAYMMIDEAVDNLAKNPSSTLHASPGPGPAPSVKSLDESPLDSRLPLSSGHRKGRRKVMKKKMLKDEEGYLG